MTLTWNGHACFTLDTEDGVVVFDPYEPDYVPGLHLPPLAGDLVLCSHDHNDHCYPAGVKQSRRMVGCRVQITDTCHDNAGGSLRGKNKVHIVEFSGLRLAHLGDLGHIPTAEQAAAIGRIDVLIIPVGGTYTLDAVEAKQVCDLLRPRTIVPMHYRKGDMGFDNIGTVEEFCALFDGYTTLPGHTLDLTCCPAGVVVFEKPNQ